MIRKNGERTIMREVNGSELRNHLPEYPGWAEAGEDILVTRRGRVVARLSAAEDPRAAAKRKLGTLRGRARVGDVVSPVGEAFSAPEATAV
jgi:antitoxin (DNA-binding transcriptional repressor) of toxin-antitoxin stability system